MNFGASARPASRTISATAKEIRRMLGKLPAVTAAGGRARSEVGCGGKTWRAFYHRPDKRHIEDFGRNEVSAALAANSRGLHVRAGRQCGMPPGAAVRR